MADTAKPRDHRGWRRLGLFWLWVVTVSMAGSGLLEWLGPPLGSPPGSATVAPSLGAPSPEVKAALRPAVVRAPVETRQAAMIATPRPVAPVVVGRDTPGPVADPEPALLEPAGEGSKENLPRVAPDGRTAMQVYAAGFDHSSRRPRIGLLLAGIGLNESESAAAIRMLPGAVSLAVSPYAVNVARLLATARTAGHEYLIALPLEPAGFPLNDPGPGTLLTSLSPAANALNLNWALSRIDGYVGATGVVGTMRGERLAAMADQMDAVLSVLAERGLLYVDPRPEHGFVMKTWGRHVDLVIDDPADRDVADRDMIDAKLTELEQLARDTGSAIGLVMRPTPVGVARMAAWSNGLSARGLALAPVSALVLPPSGAPVKLSERGE